MFFPPTNVKIPLKILIGKTMKKKKIKKITTKSNEIHTVLCLERTLCFIKIDKFDRTM